MYKRAGTVSEEARKDITIKLPHWSHFKHAGSRNTDLSFWMDSVVPADRDRDTYIVLPTQGLVMPFNTVATDTLEAEAFFR